MPHSRRSALKQFAVLGSAVAVAPSLLRGEPGSSGSLSSPRSGQSLPQSVCKWCFPKMSVADLAREGKKVGLESIELLGPEDWPALKAEGLTCAIANGTTNIPQGFNRIENHEKYIASMAQRIEECANAGIERVIVFSGNRDGMSDEEGLENCVTGLKQIMKAAEKHKVTVCMELLNSKVNHPDYMCDHTAWGVEMVKRVGSERCKLLYDIYHMQIMEGDVIRTIQKNYEAFGHYHTAGNPGRHEFEPRDVQELNYGPIMQTIKGTGYRGFIGQEFMPTRDPITSLAEAIKICRV